MTLSILAGRLFPRFLSYMMAEQPAPEATELRPRVLIVDDSPDVRLAYRFMLEIDEFRVFEAGSGRQALERLAEERIDVALIDLFMPYMDGLALIRAIQQLPHRPVIIAMSGVPHPAYESALENAEALGAQALLRKPFSKAELVGTIRGLTRGDPMPPAVRKGRSTPSRTVERRRTPRDVRDAATTGLVETVIQGPDQAVRQLADDLAGGGDMQVVRALLDSAATTTRLRGLDLSATIGRIRRELRLLGYPI